MISECYGIENFQDVLVKTNAIELLRRELASKRIKGSIGTGSMHDPYMPAEKEFNLTGQALQVINEFRFPVHINTKSDLILRDLGTSINAPFQTLTGCGRCSRSCANSLGY